MQHKRLGFLAAFLCIVPLVGGACSGPREETPNAAQTEKGKPGVYVTNYPLEYFAQRIGGDIVEVTFPAPGGEDPAFWVPDAETIIAFQNADVILLNGATYSKWLEHASLPLRKLVDTSAGYREQYMQIAGTGTHSHGPAGDHSHTGTAFTTWIDLRQAAAQAQVVTDALIGLLPKEEDLLQRNSELLVRDLLAIDSSIAALTVGQASVPLFASHPVYQYFSRRYGLNMVSVLWEPDVFPADAKWAELRRLHARHPSQWMVWGAEPLVESVTRLEGMGVQSVVFDPCGNRPEEGDFLTVMRKNVENLRTVFSHRNGKN